MLTYFVILPILIAVILYLFPSAKSSRIGAIISQGILLIAAVYLFSISDPYNHISVAIGHYEGVLGIVLRADTLTATFVLLTTFIFLIAAIYSFEENNSRLFWFLFFLWEGTILGIFLTGDFFNIFVLMEVSTLVVSILIMFNRKNRSLYDGMIYLMINVIIIQFFLFGVGYVYSLTGTLDMLLVQERVAYLDRSFLVLPYALLITFISLKCALIPLYNWLPKAHGTPGAPSAVSAILSGLHIKTGIYLFMRFQSIFEPVAMPEIFIVIGIITALFGIFLAISQNDIKLMLAYSTIAQMGLIIIGLSISYTNSYNYIGSLYHIINHAVFKAALFLGSGIISYAYKTRDITEIRGVFKTMPVISVAKILAILGIIGTPLFNGSISKYFLMTGVEWWLNTIMIIINLGTIVIFMKYCTIFFGKKEDHINAKVDLLRHVPVLVLGFICFFGGIFGVWAIEFLFGLQVSVDTWGYIEKTVIFLVSFLVGYFIYKYFVIKNPIFNKIREFDPGFREMCVSIGVFLAIILVVVGFGY